MRPKDQTRDQDKLFHGTLVKETDRGVALVSAAYLGEELKTLLEKMFVVSPKIVNALFESNGPLATFSSRIDVAFASGLISQESHRLFHLIRKIRNDFAHQHQDISFEEGTIAARCTELVTVIPRFGEKKPRVLYIRAVMYLLAEIHARAKRVQHAKVRSFKPVGYDFDYLRMESAIESLTSTWTYEERLRFISPKTSEEEKKRLVVESFRRSGSAGVQLLPRRKRKSKADARINSQIARHLSNTEADMSALTERLRRLTGEEESHFTAATLSGILRAFRPEEGEDIKS